MNFKALVKQTERQVTATKNVAKAVAKEKSEILLEFSKDIFEYLLFINSSKDFRFSAEAHYQKGSTTQSLLEDRVRSGSKIPYVIETAKREIKERTATEFRTSGMSYFFGSVKIRLSINENFIPSVSYETSYLSKTDRHEFTDKEEFVKSFTQFLITYRK